MIRAEGLGAPAECVRVPLERLLEIAGQAQADAEAVRSDQGVRIVGSEGCLGGFERLLVEG